MGSYCLKKGEIGRLGPEICPKRCFFWGSGQVFSRFFAYIYGNMDRTRLVDVANERYGRHQSGKKGMKLGSLDHELEPLEWASILLLGRILKGDVFCMQLQKQSIFKLFFSGYCNQLDGILVLKVPQLHKIHHLPIPRIRGFLRNSEVFMGFLLDFWHY